MSAKAGRSGMVTMPHISATSGTSPMPDLLHYGDPMPAMVDRVAELEAKVNGHLKRMGFAWK